MQRKSESEIFHSTAQKLLGAWAAEMSMIANQRQQAAIENQEARDLIRTLRDETQSASVHARCVAIVGERS